MNTYLFSHFHLATQLWQKFLEDESEKQLLCSDQVAPYFISLTDGLCPVQTFSFLNPKKLLGQAIRQKYTEKPTSNLIITNPMGYQNLHAVIQLSIEKIQHVIPFYELGIVEIEPPSYRERTYLKLFSRLTKHHITHYRYLHIVEYGLSESEYTPPQKSPMPFPTVNHEYDLIILDWEYMPQAINNPETHEILLDFFKDFESIAIKPHPFSRNRGFCETSFSFPILPAYIPAETLSNPRVTGLAKDTSTAFSKLVLLDNLINRNLSSQ